MKALRWIGRILMLSAFVFLGRRLWQYKNSIHLQLTWRLFLMLGGVCILYSLVILLCPIIYQRLLILVGNYRFSYKRIAGLFCKTNLYKYLPGNVVQYVGRNELAVEENLPHGRVVLATVLEIVVGVAAGILVSAVFAGKYALRWMRESLTIRWYHILAAFLITVGLLVVLCFALKKKTALNVKELQKPIYGKTLFALVLYNSGILVLFGVLYYGVMRLIGAEFPPGQFLTQVGLYALAYLVGFITPGAPGGLGVRETILVYFFSAFLQEELVLTGAILFRIVSVIGDVLAYIFSLGMREVI